ncbi:MAG TPA: MFS transporter [Aldersonia sp.]
MTNELTEQIPARAGRREWLGLGVIALACALYSMDLTVLHLAVPVLAVDLEPSSTQLLWIIDIYGFMLAGCLITTGSLGDRIGRRRLLLIGAAAFGCASVAAAYSTSPEMLIATRAVLGVAGATLAPSTLALIRTMFSDAEQRTTAVGIWITSFSIGAVVGPAVGGVLLEFFWWGSVFLINLPVMVVLLVLAPRILPEFRDVDAGRADPASAVLSLAAILALVYAIKHTAQGGFSGVSAVTAVAGCLLGWAFVRRNRRLPDPLIDPTLLRIPAFDVAIVTYGVGVLILFGGFLFLAQYRQLSLGMSPLVAGLAMVPASLAFILATNLTPPLARRVAPTTLIGGGLVVAAGGYVTLLTLEPGNGDWQTVIGPIVFSIGLAPLFTLTNDTIIAGVPPERAGAATGISETSAEVGGTLGIAVLGSLAMAVYRPRVDAALAPDTTAHDADAARNTLAGALDVADRLPHDEAARLVAAAQSAFTTGLHIAAAIGAVASIALAAFVLTVGRRVLARSEPKTLR